jgi:CubicO group peptidase (beta-lactamase class C family)
MKTWARTHLPRIGRFILAGLMLSSAAAPSLSQERPAPPAVEAGNVTGTPLTHDDLAAWLDGLLPYAIKQGDIAGGVVSVVKDGRVLFQRGYGYADVAQKRPMDPVHTIIRPGSISKLFLWTAVMQLVEDKKLDLDTDVNRYIDFHIPAFEGRAITLRDIVTHRTGFAEQIKGLIGCSPPNSLEAYVKGHIPARIYPAGAVPAYSNYGSALAAHIVERVSGERFEVYTARHILSPLGMSRSTFAQPVPPAWRVNLALGYRKASEAPRYYEYIGPVPAGGLNTTADDMTRFMIAQLNRGTFNGKRIFSAETARAMHAPQGKTFPALNTMAVGFYETTRNGHRSIAHNGGTQFFHSDLHLLVNDNVGLFISLNSAGDGDATKKIHDAFFNGFMDRYFPDKAGPARDNALSLATARDHSASMQGYWESSRRSGESWLGLQDLFNPIWIGSDGNGRLSFPFPARGIVVWTEIAPFVWQSDDGDRMRALTRDGRPVMVGFDAAPPAAFLPVPWWRSPGWLLPALALSLAALTSYGLALPVGAVMQRRYGVNREPAAGKGLHRASKLLSLGLVGAALAYPIVLSQFGDDADLFSARTDAAVLTLEAATLALLVATMATHVWISFRAWKLRLSWSFKAVASLLVVATGVLWWAAIAFGLINFSMNY